MNGNSTWPAGRPGAARPWKTNGPGEFARWLLRRPRRAEPQSVPGSGSTTRSEKRARIEAALFVAREPTPARKLVQFATLADAAEANRLVERLNAAYDATGSAFRVERVASGYQLVTRAEFAFWLGRLHRRKTELKLTPPQLETLTLIAYRQPITRADVEAVRGVQCADMLKQLMERGLVKIGGEDESLGRPYLYVTTRKFLEMYGLRSLDGLPMADTLRRPASGTAVSTDDADEAAVAAA